MIIESLTEPQTIRTRPLILSVSVNTRSRDVIKLFYVDVECRYQLYGEMCSEWRRGADIKLGSDCDDSVAAHCVRAQHDTS